MPRASAAWQSPPHRPGDDGAATVDLTWPEADFDVEAEKARLAEL